MSPNKGKSLKVIIGCHHSCLIDKLQIKIYLKFTSKVNYPILLIYILKIINNLKKDKSEVFSFAFVFFYQELLNI